MIIRSAVASDIPGLIAIWNPIIRDTTIIFHNQEKTPESVAATMAERQQAGHGFFVADEGGRIPGFSTYAQFRGGNGYATAMEHSVLLAPEARGRGIGRALMARLEDHARGAGAHTLFGGISGENPKGIAFHQTIGFREVARLPETGRKFGRWLDLVLMMKTL